MAAVDHYQTLGIGRRASEREVARAFRATVRLAHPDGTVRQAHPDQAAHIRAVIEAGEVLRDPERRRQYDLGLRAAGAAPVSFYHRAGWWERAKHMTRHLLGRRRPTRRVV